MEVRRPKNLDKSFKTDLSNDLKYPSCVLRLNSYVGAVMKILALKTQERANLPLLTRPVHRARPVHLNDSHDTNNESISLTR